MTDKELRERAEKVLRHLARLSHQRKINYGKPHRDPADYLAAALKDAYRRGMEAMRGAAFDAWMNGDKRRGWQPFEEAAARLLEGAKHG